MYGLKLCYAWLSYFRVGGGKSFLECSVKPIGQHKLVGQSIPEYSFKPIGQYKSAGQVTFERPYFLKKRIFFLARVSLQSVVLSFNLGLSCLLKVELSNQKNKAKYA
jgi:hypothetical protein